VAAIRSHSYDTHLGNVCTACWQPCATCEDALLGDALKIDGQYHHVACAEELMHNRLLAQLAASVRLEAAIGS
jgi:hypothetical protein